MKNTVFVILIFILLAIGSFSMFGCKSDHLENSTSKRPNIILIMADDMGYSDLGCFGSEIHTPNLDQLALEGLRMTHFYNAARCCPSRASLLTGLYPHQAGVGDMNGDDHLPAYRGFLNKNTVTLAEVLKSAGYYTMMSGKWHVGEKAEHWPMKRGFQHQYGSTNTTGHYFGVARGRTYLVEDTIQSLPGDWIELGRASYKLLKNKDGSQWYATDAYTDHAIDYIRQLRQNDKEQPFFLYLPYTSPHWPLHAFEEDIEKYLGSFMIGWDSLRQQRYEKMLDIGILDASWQLSPRNEMTKDWNELSEDEKVYYDRLMAVYAAMVDRMDQNVGKLLAAIKATGDLDNTIVIFFSDNGGCHEPIHWGKEGEATGGPDSFDGYEYSWANVSNTPFQWFKHWTHEGGSSTSFIAWYPQMIEAGRIDHQVGHIIDIMPTLCELANTEYPEKYTGNTIIPKEGLSLVPVFKGKERKPHDFLCWEHEGNKAVRQGDWKLVSRFHYDSKIEGEWELYNLRDDRSEMYNLASDFPEKLIDMEKIYTDWAAKCNVMPYNEFLQHRKELKNERE